MPRLAAFCEINHIKEGYVALVVWEKSEVLDMILECASGCKILECELDLSARQLTFQGFDFSSELIATSKGLIPLQRDP